MDPLADVCAVRILECVLSVRSLSLPGQPLSEGQLSRNAVALVDVERGGRGGGGGHPSFRGFDPRVVPMVVAPDTRNESGGGAPPRRAGRPGRALSPCRPSVPQ